MPMDMQQRRDTSHRCYVSDKLCFHLQTRKAPILVDPLDRAIHIIGAFLAWWWKQGWLPKRSASLKN